MPQIISIAQLSDTHICAPGQLLFNGVDSAIQLQKAIDWLLQDQVSIQAILISGDLTQDGKLEEYQHLRKLLEPLKQKMPVYLVMGNHDHYHNCQQIFFDYPGLLHINSTIGLQYEFHLGSRRFLILDSLELGIDQGHLNSDRLAWLENKLQQSMDRTVIVIHHPMIRIGNSLMDEMHLYEVEAFGKIVESYDHIEMILCGHIHRTIFSRFKNIPLVICPSTAHQYPVNLTHALAKKLSSEAPGFLIHQQLAEGQMVTHQIPISGYSIIS
jgi:3',5'-cyclic-AMP phosphodiesterase